MKGKKHTDEWRKQQSEDMKKEKNPFYGKTWTNETHPKGMKGKKHSENSKKQTSETIKNMITKSCTKVKITMPNGEERIFNKAREALDFLGISTSIYYKLLNTGKPYRLSKNTTTNVEFLKTLEGLIIEKID